MNILLASPPAPSGGERFSALRSDVAALLAKKGAVTRAQVQSILDAHPEAE